MRMVFCVEKLRRFRSLLLQGRSRERQRSLAASLALLNFVHEQRLALTVRNDLETLCLTAEFRLLLADAVVARFQRLFAALGVRLGFQGPVLLRHKSLNLGLAVAYHTKRDRLHSAGGESALYLCPEQGAYAVTHHAV